MQRKPYEHFADQHSVRLIVDDYCTDIFTNSLLGYKYGGEIKGTVSWAVHVQDGFFCTGLGYSKPSRVSSRKKFVCALFLMNPYKLYISRKVIKINVEFDKIIFCFDFCLVLEVVNSKKTS